MGKYFTKSAFRQALFCPASLYYYYDGDHYANQQNEDDFLQALAEGGQQVGDLAKLYYQIDSECDIKPLEYEDALARTKKLFERDEVTIAEAAFQWENCFIRADIIEKKGTEIHLIEVKAKSWEDGKSFLNTKNAIDSDIRDYVYDIAFQKYVIQNALGPDYSVTASLMMADKSIVSNAPQGVNQFFEVEKEKGLNGSKDRVVINRKPGADELRNYNWVLKAFPVDDICKMVFDGETREQSDPNKPYLKGLRFKKFVQVMSTLYVNHKQAEHEKSILLTGSCFKCPFRLNEKTPQMADGHKECWMKSARFREEDFTRPSVGDLWCGKAGRRSIKDELVRNKKYFLDQITKNDILPNNPRVPDSGLAAWQRRLLQIGLATGERRILEPFQRNILNGVFLDIDGLQNEMHYNWHFPLHMIDFETTAVALPFYEGMRPYEQVAFQFSHHIIYEDGRIEHKGQFINTSKHHFPNFDFIRELKRQLEGDKGTIFRYAAHENTILRAILAQLEASSEQDKNELEDFINDISHPTDNEVKAGVENKSTRDMVDLLEIVLRYYYSPMMKGSNSIKAVLPAILNSSKYLQEKYSKPIYGNIIPSLNYTNGETVTWIKTGPEGKVMNPYKELKTIADFLGVTEEQLDEFDTKQEEKNEEKRNEGTSSIANGGAALAAYTKLQFSDEEMTNALKEALLRYCELDTMSMVFIWEYFHEMCK